MHSSDLLKNIRLIACASENEKEFVVRLMGLLCNFEETATQEEAGKIKKELLNLIKRSRSLSSSNIIPFSGSFNETSK